MEGFIEYMDQDDTPSRGVLHYRPIVSYDPSQRSNIRGIRHKQIQDQVCSPEAKSPDSPPSPAYETASDTDRIDSPPALLAIEDRTATESSIRSKSKSPSSGKESDESSESRSRLRALLSARQKAAFKKHIQRCGSPPGKKGRQCCKAVLRDDTGTYLSGRVVEESGDAERIISDSEHAHRSGQLARMRVDFFRGDSPVFEYEGGGRRGHEFAEEPRSVSSRMDTLASRRSRGRYQPSPATTKRTRPQAEIEAARPSYSRVVFPLSAKSVAELFPSGNHPPEPAPSDPVRCPPTASRATIGKKSGSRKKSSVSIPGFTPKPGAPDNAWKSGICGCWRDPESYWSGVMEQVV